MIRCLTKFPPTDNPIVVVPNVGNFIKYEVHNHRPCPLIDEFFEKGTLRINPKLFNGSFVFTKKQIETLKNWKSKVTE